MSDSIQAITDKLSGIFSKANEALSEWTEDGNLQFPVLMGKLAVKLNLDDKQLREIDPIVRYYVRNHRDYEITRGAHGGIMRLSDKKKKDESRKAKEKLKAEMLALVDAKIAKSKVVDSDESDDGVDSTTF